MASEAAMKLTVKQRQLVDRITAGCGYLSYSRSSGDRGVWFIARPYSEENARVCGTLLEKGGLIRTSRGEYDLAECLKPNVQSKKLDTKQCGHLNSL